MKKFKTMMIVAIAALFTNASFAQLDAISKEKTIY